MVTAVCCKFLLACSSVGCISSAANSRLQQKKSFEQPFHLWEFSVLLENDFYYVCILQLSAASFMDTRVYQEGGPEGGQDLPTVRPRPARVVQHARTLGRRGRESISQISFLIS